MNTLANVGTTHAPRGPRQLGADRSQGNTAAPISPFHALYEGAQP
jgi:hypothetical protein